MEGQKERKRQDERSREVLRTWDIVDVPSD